MSGDAQSHVIRFGEFEVVFGQRELRRQGMRIPLQHKPFQILELLLKTPGALVTRDDIAGHLWPGSQVSVERSLNTAMNNLRQALGDSSHEARLIETRPGLGYVFIGKVAEITRQHRDRNQDYLKGCYLMDKLTEEDTRKAIAYFEAAATQPGDAALIYAGLAHAHCELARLSFANTRSAAQKAKDYAQIALHVNPDAAETHCALGRVRMLFNRDWDAAQNEFARALKIDPENGSAHRFLASLLLIRDETEAALPHMQRAQSLEPLSLPIGVDMAWSLYLARNHDAAVEQCWKILALEPRFWAAQMALGLSYAQLGLHEEADTELQNAVECSGGHPVALAALKSPSMDAIGIFFGCLASSTPASLAVAAAR